MSQPTEHSKTILNFSEVDPKILRGEPQAAETVRANAGHPECPKCGGKHSAKYSEKVVEGSLETTHHYLQCLNCGNRVQTENKEK